MQPLWATAVGFFNFVNDLKWRNCKHESCVSRKVMKFYSLQLFRLMSFRALKNNLYPVRYNMRRKKLSMDTCDFVV
jgi:hypothetical protein